MPLRALMLAFACAGCTATGFVAAPLAAAAPQASVSLESCHRSGGQGGRSAVFVADMHAIRGARAMAIRLDLQRRRDDHQRWHTVHASGLGEWHRSEPGVDIFRYRKVVTNLAGAASYRAVARYRWYGAGGKVVTRAKRATGACRQPDPRPDLLAADLTLQPASAPDRARYVITLRNKGRREAGEFEAIVYVDGRREGTVLVPDLAGHARQAITIEAPRCGLGSSVLVVLDSDDRVEESRETNNTTRFACPL